MPSIIPLSPNKPYQKFSVTLGDYTLGFTASYVARFEYFRIDISDVTGIENIVTIGRIANPDIDLVSGTFGKYGRIYIDGDQPTLENLGVTALLKWEAANV